MPSAILIDIIIIFALSMLVVYLGQRLGVPSILGFLLTGILAGPHGLGLIANVHEVEVLAEIGVVLLLFTIGLEFSFGALARLRHPLLLGGSLQVLLTMAGAGVAALLLGQAWGPGLFVGCVLALSSTAIVLKLLQERAAMDTPHGRVVLAVLLYQDVIVVAMLLVTPLLGGQGAGPEVDKLALLGKGVMALVVLALAGKWAVPWLLHQMAGTRSRELFMVSIVVLCLAVSWLTSWAGLSLALGAFLAGLIISESPYSHQAVGHILPLRDLFTSLFFVSIGMLLNLSFLLDNPLAVGLVTLGVILLKTLTGGLAALGLRLSVRVALPTGLILAQVGEFAFVLARAGLERGLLDDWTYQLLLVVSVLTMAITPALVALGFRLAKRPLPEAPPAAPTPGEASAGAEGLSGHVIVVGYGLGGRNVASAARLAGIPYVVLEMNPFTVRQEQAQGQPLVYGDAVNPAVLEQAGLERARAMVVTIPDPVATRHIVGLAKQLHPGLHVIARTRFLEELRALKDLGADEVVSEEYESAVEIFALILQSFHLPQEEIWRLVAEMRAQGYQALRGGPSLGEPPLPQGLSGLWPDLEITTLAIRQGAPAAGRSLAELQLRKRHGLTALALHRRGQTQGNPEAETVLQAGDWLVVLARQQDLARARHLFRPAAEDPSQSAAGSLAPSLSSESSPKRS
ncbi:MAG: cation:proton antiporter [Pseudomonadota bacterium]